MSLTRSFLRTLFGTFTLALLAACGSGGGDPTPPAADTPALALAAPGELVADAQARLRQRQSQLSGRPDAVFGTGAPTAVAAGPTATPPPRSSTVVLEDGVDEADLIKTDGTRLFTLQPQPATGGRVQVHRRLADGAISLAATLPLPDGGALDNYPAGLHLSDDGRALAALTMQWVQTTPEEACPGCTSLRPGPPVWMKSQLAVQRIDVADPATAAAGTRVVIEGHLVDSRRVGNLLYVVTTHAPVLAPELLPLGASAEQREAAIASVAAADLLPRVRVNGGPAQPLVAETECWLQPGNGSLAVEFTTLTVFDLASHGFDRTSRCFAGGSEAVAMTTSSLYLATTRSYYPLGDVLIYPRDLRTDLHKFALAGSSISYRGSGDVAGHLGWEPSRKPTRLSEHNGDLRVISFTGTTGWVTLADSTSKPASPALLSVLRERDGRLVTVSTLPNDRRTAAIGKPDEQLYAVRFAGPRAYAVTFRIVDPLYVLDLADPADPKVAGELEVSGVTDHLFPLSDALLFGVGRSIDANGRVTGLKFSLFDVADPTRPTERASVEAGNGPSATALDLSRQGLNWMLVDGVARIALPVSLATGQGDSARHGLQRFEVNLQARTLQALTMLGGGTSPVWFQTTFLERSAQIGAQVYYLEGGLLNRYDW